MSIFNRAERQTTDSEQSKIWNPISGTENIDAILRASSEKPQIIYKHSHRCSVCILAKEELEGIADQVLDSTDLYMINVIHQRDLSNAIASTFDVRHESPQVIIIKDGEVAWKGSHWAIKGKDILNQLS
ncbi:bacillithiol system redox-active protein YtxJ [Aliifodinibius sp. S!AR15-10]|uniref:bacillithiol system redox-active protein YtxJ n=1 Tax=Aliifodinibius sp. S!AR15-10 TaxID=2950437 RepID=UPI00285528F0|nr:bacillithiol system redox-active protein YtxJ [Aliifodinibius sp. S!AR15-10]MDR8394276.1 bacillithiol system redox-active protein YtxJ [Aliifodinibius sp. S!AR15-10]